MPGFFPKQPARRRLTIIGCSARLRNNGSKLRFRLKTNGTTATLVASSGALTPGVWTHVSATYDGQFMRVYKDGVEVGTLAKTGAVDRNATIPGVGGQ